MHVADDRLTGPAEVRQIVVPSPWQAQFHDLRMRAGIGIYRRSIEIPEGWLRDAIWIRFGAVFHNSKVLINDQLVGSNEGGFLPFSFDITEHLRPGKNEIKVRVDSPTDNPAEFPDSPFAEIPFGKQSWYGPLSGIWQSVFLERRIVDHMTRIRLLPNRDTGLVTAALSFAAPISDSSQIRVEIMDPSGAVAVEQTLEAQPGITSMPFVFKIDNVLSWSPDEPLLYQVRITLDRDGETRDTISDHFGFRTIETRNGKFCLNGEPLYLRGALDQDYYPDTICTVPSHGIPGGSVPQGQGTRPELPALPHQGGRSPLLRGRRSLGMLVWTELPNGGPLTERSRAAQGDTAEGHRRPRRQPSVDRHLDDHQRELGRRPRPRRRSP